MQETEHHWLGSNVQRYLVHMSGREFAKDWARLTGHYCPSWVQPGQAELIYESDSWINLFFMQSTLVVGTRSHESGVQGEQLPLSLMTPLKEWAVEGGGSVLLYRECRLWPLSSLMALFGVWSLLYLIYLRDHAEWGCSISQLGRPVAAENSRITEDDPATRLRPRHAMSKRHEQRHASIWWHHTPKICASKLEVKALLKASSYPRVWVSFEIVDEWARVEILKRAKTWSDLALALQLHPSMWLAGFRGQ